MVSHTGVLRREEGPAALYRGFLPKAIRLGIGQTIGLMVFKRLLVAMEADQQRG